MQKWLINCICFLHNIYTCVNVLQIFDILSFSLKQIHSSLHCPLALKYNFGHLKTLLRWLVLKGLQSATGSSIPLTRHSGSGEMPAGSGRSSHLQLLFLRKTQRALGTMGHPILGLACWFAFPWCSSRLPGQCRHRQHSRCTNQSVGGGGVACCTRLSLCLSKWVRSETTGYCNTGRREEEIMFRLRMPEQWYYVSVAWWRFTLAPLL